MSKSKLLGAKKVKDALKKYQKEYPQALAGAIYQEAVFIMGNSLKQTPRKDGFLRGSAFVTPPIATSKRPVCILGYGVDYAAAVHEGTEKHFTVGNAKFLENALNAVQKNYLNHLKKNTEKNIQRGVGIIASSNLPKEYKKGNKA